MDNLFKRLKQRQNFLCIDEETINQYKESLKEINTEINEDFIDEIISFMLLHDLPIQINDIIENSKNLGELKNTKVTIEIKEKDSSSLFGEVYNIHEISNYFRFIEPNYYSVGIINKIEIDYELKELFIKRLRNRLNVYNSNNKEVVSGFIIQENKNSKSKIESFDIVGSVKDLIKLFYSELQAYNYNNTNTEKKKYDDCRFKSMLKIMKPQKNTLY